MRSLYESILNINTNDVSNNTEHNQNINNQFAALICDVIKGANDIKISKNGFHDTIFTEFSFHLSSLKRAEYENRIYKFRDEFKSIQKEFKKLWGINRVTFEDPLRSDYGVTTKDQDNVMRRRDIKCSIGNDMSTRNKDGNFFIIGLPFYNDRRIIMRFSKNMISIMETAFEMAHYTGALEELKKVKMS